ncbi:MAG: PilN domain-containing protein [Nitrospirae bacterium]|nr:PilN domain-containing protein [Nitrospirota bacterium]
MNTTVVIKKFTTLANSSSTLIKRVWNPIWKILSFSPADDLIYPAKNISVAIEKGSISVALGRRFLSKITLKGFKEYNFEDMKYPLPEALTSSLSLTVNEFNAAKTEVTLCIPKAWAVFKTVEFPIAVAENLTDVISYEIDRLTPFNSEDAWYDYKIIGQTSEKIILQLVAAKADTINPYIQAIKEKGMNITRLTVSLSGMETLCRYIDKNMESLFIKISDDEYEGALFSNVSITGIFTGNFSEKNDDAKIETITSEISPLIDVLKSKGKTPQIKVLLSNKNALIKELLKSRLNQPIIFFDETALKLKLSGTVKETTFEAIGSMIESLWPKAKGFNLMQKGYHAKEKTPITLSVILMLAIAGMWFFYITSPLKIEEKRLQEIDKQISLRRDEVKKTEALKNDIEKLSKEISTINNFKQNRPMALNLLKEVTTILPKNTWLSRMRITETEVNLEGYATSATGLLSKLEASQYFKKAEFASPTFRDSRMNADRFNIKMEIEGATKLEPQKPVEIIGEEDEEE